MLKFRPHHFLCTLGFRGMGYSDAFVREFTRIVEKLRAAGGDSTSIEVASGADAICEACPNRRGVECETEDRVQELDRSHSAVMGWVSGERLSWGEAKRRISERMTIDDFHMACASCSWKASGVCEQALIELLTHSSFKVGE